MSAALDKDSDKVAFTNSYDTKTSISLEGTKSLTGRNKKKLPRKPEMSADETEEKASPEAESSEETKEEADEPEAAEEAALKEEASEENDSEEKTE